MRCCWTKSRHLSEKVSKLVCASPYIAAHLGGGREEGRGEGWRERRAEEGKKSRKCSVGIWIFESRGRYPVADCYLHRNANCCCLHGDKQLLVLAAVGPVWVVVKNTDSGASC